MFLVTTRLSPCCQKWHLMNYSLNQEWVSYRDKEGKESGTEPGEKWWQVIFHHCSPLTMQCCFSSLLWHTHDLIWPSLGSPSAPITKWKPLLHTLQTAGGAEPSQEKGQSSRFTGLNSVISACVLVFAFACKSESVCMCVNHYCWWCFLFLLRVIVGMPGGRHLEP